LPKFFGDVFVLFFSQSCSADGHVRIWSLKTGKCDSSLHAHQDAIFDVITLADGRLGIHTT